MIITTKSMLEYYKDNFDAIDFKYKSIPEGEYSKIVEYEASHQFASLTKKHYAEDYANLNLVYGDRRKNEEIIDLMNLISIKVISQYINIDGLERLFSEKYIEFEWEMHLSADYEKHNMNFYRDHFIHQIRDAYTMHILLENFDVYEHVKTILNNESESKVSRFVHRCLNQQKHCHAGELRQKVLNEDKDFYIRNMIYMASAL